MIVDRDTYETLRSLAEAARTIREEVISGVGPRTDTVNEIRALLSLLDALDDAR